MENCIDLPLNYFVTYTIPPVTPVVQDRTMGQGPVVQSIVSLTSSLRGQLDKCFTTL